MFPVNNSTHTKLFEEITNSFNLYHSYKQVLQNKKSNNDTIDFIYNAEYYLHSLKKDLRNYSYRPKAPFSFKIYQPKERLISSFKIKDMIVQKAILNKTHDLFIDKFINDSYGGLVNKGPIRALEKIKTRIRQSKFYLKCDVASFYASIDHEILKKQLRKIIKDHETYLLILQFVDIDPCSKGISIGALLSQYFANIYLTDLDNFIKCFLGIKHYVRYMDDFVLFCDDKEYLEYSKNQIELFLLKKLKLKLQKKITIIDSTLNGVDFLGFRTFSGTTRVRRKNMVMIRRKIKNIHNKFQKGLIPSEKYEQKIHGYINHLNKGDTTKHNRKFFEFINNK